MDLNWTYRIPLLITLLLIPSLSCQSIKEGTQSASSYLRGEYRTVLAVSLPEGLKAIRQSLNELSLSKQRDESDALTGIFECTNVKGQKIILQLEKVTARTSSLTIRVDIFGDEALSEVIAETIRKNLR